jgi:hypothetical protein
MAGLLGVELRGTFDALIGDADHPKRLMLDFEPLSQAGDETA